MEANGAELVGEEQAPNPDRFSRAENRGARQISERRALLGPWSACVRLALRSPVTTTHLFPRGDDQFEMEGEALPITHHWTNIGMSVQHALSAQAPHARVPARGSGAWSVMSSPASGVNPE